MEERQEGVGCVMTVGGDGRHSTGWPKKSKPSPIFQKIALKIANEIIFFRKGKV